MNDTGTWLKKIEPEILEQLGKEYTTSSAPSFPLSELTKSLISSFSIDHLDITYGLCEWKAHDALLSGFGQNPISLPLQVTPLEGTLFWIMPGEDIKKLLSWMKLGSGKPLKFDHPDLIKGVYRYVALEILEMIHRLKSWSDLSIKLADKQSFDETLYTMDISIKKESEVVWGRLAISPNLKRSFENHFAIKRVSLKDLEGQIGDIFLPLSMNIGTVELTEVDLKMLSVGDFIVPDTIHYNPKSERGNIRVMMGEKALFVAKPKEREIKLMDFVYAYEEMSHG